MPRARALAVQRELAKASDGNHRRSPVDFMIAAAAEAAGDEVTLWCFDRDLKVICEHTGQACEAEESTLPGPPTFQSQPRFERLFAFLAKRVA